MFLDLVDKYFINKVNVNIVNTILTAMLFLSMW